MADALLTEEIRPRAMTINDGVLVALRGINKNPGAENPWAFLLFLLFLVGIVVAQMLWFRRKKWF